MSAHLRGLISELTSPQTMMAAEEEFLKAGADAIPVLAAIFNGEAKNEFGVPFRKLGLPLRCALEIVKRMGPIAKPLERYIRDEVARGVHWPAAAALRYMPPLEDESVVALAGALKGDFDMAHEAACTLVQLGHSEHPVVRHEVATSPEASKVWRWTTERGARKG